MVEYEDVAFEEQRQLSDAITSEPIADAVMPNGDTLLAIKSNMDNLQDLRDTVSTEGISVHEIQMLNVIRDNLTKMGVLKSEELGLESYGNLFSSTRTELNKTIGMESITDTIVKTIKAWIAKLIEYLAKTIQWVKSMMVSYEINKGNMDRYNTSVSVLFTNFVKVYNLEQPSRERVDPQLEELALACLRAPALDRCEFGLVAFGTDRHGNNNQVSWEHINSLMSGNLLTFTENFVKALNSNVPLTKKDVTLPGLFSLTSIKSSAANIRNTLEPVDDLDFYINELPGKGLDPKKFYMDMRGLIKRNIIDFKPQYDLFVNLANNMRKIRKFDIGDDDNITDLINSINVVLTEVMNVQKEMVALSRKRNMIQQKVTATYINFYLSAIGIIKKDLSDHGLSDKYDRIIASIKKTIDRVKMDLGIMSF